jgi:hypothetical protein
MRLYLQKRYLAATRSVNRLDQLAVYEEAYRVYLDAYHRANTYTPEQDQLWHDIHTIIFIGVDHSDDWYKKRKLAEIRKGLRELDLISSPEVRELMVVLTHILTSKVKRGRPSRTSRLQMIEALRMKQGGKTRRDIAKILYRDPTPNQIDSIPRRLKR